MSILNLVEDNTSNMYLKHSWALGRFVSTSDEPYDFKHFVIDLDFRTGFTKWVDQQKFVVWDKEPGIKPDNWRELVKDDYKRSFWCRVFVKDIGILIWERNGRPELEVFDQMITDAWKTKDENPGKVPVFEYKGAEKVKYGMASGYKANIEFVKWTDKPAEFDELPSAPVAEDADLDDGIPF